MSALSVFRQHGLLFEYPQDWELEEQVTEHGDVTISVGDGAAFWALTLMWERPEVDKVLHEAKQAFEEEYEEVDVDTFRGKISRRDAEGYDMQFVCMEFVNHVSLRCFRSGRFTAFLMSQMTDHEFDYYTPLFNEMTESLDVDQDGGILIG